MTHAVRYWLGLTDPAGGPYLWWSGFGGRVALGGALILTYLRHHNCHTSGCWRFGHADETGTVVCRRHRGSAA